MPRNGLWNRTSDRVFDKHRGPFTLPLLHQRTMFRYTRDVDLIRRIADANESAFIQFVANRVIANE